MGTMFIECKETGESVTTTYKIEPRQTCEAYTSDGAMSFEDIVVEVEGQIVQNAQWTAQQEQPACASKAIVKDSSTIEFTWDPKSTDAPQYNRVGPAKWGPGRTVVV